MTLPHTPPLQVVSQRSSFCFFNFPLLCEKDLWPSQRPVSLPSLNPSPSPKTLLAPASTRILLSRISGELCNVKKGHVHDNIKNVKNIARMSLSLSSCLSYQVSWSLWPIVRKVKCVYHSSAVLQRRWNQKSDSLTLWKVTRLSWKSLVLNFVLWICED